MFANRRLSRALKLTAFAPFLAIIAGCPPRPNPDAGDNGPAELLRFNSPDELLAYFKSQAMSQSGGGLRAYDLGAPLAPGAEADGAAGADDQGSSFTTTNIQEAGVDESDIFKSDGTYFYIAKNSSLRIVRAQPRGELAEVGRLDLGEGQYVDSMYLFNGSVILLASEYSFGVPGVAIAEIWPPFYGGGKSVVYEIDVSDPAKPAISRQIELDGSLASSRLTNGRLILVLSIVPELPAPANPLTIGLMTLDEMMPKARSAGAVREVVAWDGWLRPGNPDGYFTTAVVTLDADDIEQIVAAVALMSNSSTIYASTEALYVTNADYDAANNYRETAEIHKFAFDDDGAARYAASGSVPGRLLNQFSLGEHEGYLRVATHIAPTFFLGGGIDDAIGFATGVEPTARAAGSGLREQDSTPPQPSNSVYVLAEADGKLEAVGQITGIAPGEQLYSARFMAERGFLVTFIQIDPLFALDLSDPQNPQVVGELKVPGFSDYLHPLGENHLIGVGRSVAQAPWGGAVPDAVQLSLFDVSDLSNPMLVDQVEIGGPYSSSDVSYTHKAFTLTEDGTLAIPAQLMPQTQNDFEWSPEFDGLLLFHVDPAAGFESLGRLASVLYQDSFGFGWVEWRRGAIIDGDVYIVTPQGVRAARMDDLGSTNNIELERSPEDIAGGEDSGGATADGGAGEPGSTGVDDSTVKTEP